MTVSLFCSVSGHKYSNRRKNGGKYTGWVNTWQSLLYHEWHAIPYLLIKKNPHWPDLYIHLKGSCKQFLLIFLSLLWCFLYYSVPFLSYLIFPLHLEYVLFLYYYMVVNTKVVFPVPHSTHSSPSNFFICQS